MNPLSNVPKQSIKADFAFKGLTFQSFADKNGFKASSVRYAFMVYCGERKKPNGMETTKILTAIRRIFDEKPVYKGYPY